MSATDWPPLSPLEFATLATFGEQRILRSLCTKPTRFQFVRRHSSTQHMTFAAVIGRLCLYTLVRCVRSSPQRLVIYGHIAKNSVPVWVARTQHRTHRPTCESTEKQVSVLICSIIVADRWFNSICKSFRSIHWTIIVIGFHCSSAQLTSVGVNCFISALFVSRHILYRTSRVAAFDFSTHVDFKHSNYTFAWELAAMKRLAGSFSCVCPSPHSSN